MDAVDDVAALVLMRLGEGCPALTPDCGRSLAEAAAVCLARIMHDVRRQRAACTPYRHMTRNPVPY